MKSLPLSLIALVAGGCPSSLQGDLTEAEGDITALRAELDLVTARLALMEAALGVDPEAEAPAAVLFEDLRGDVGQLRTDVDEAESRLDAVESVNAQQASDLAALDVVATRVDRLDEELRGASTGIPGSRLDSHETSIAELEAGLTDAESRMDEAEETLAAHTESIALLGTDLAARPTTQTVASTYQTLAAASATLASLQSTLGALDGRVSAAEEELADVGDRWITDDLVLTVVADGATPPPGQYATAHDALEYLADKHIVAPATVTIRLTAGTHTYAEPIVLNHPDGARIILEGVGSGGGGTRIASTTTYGVIVQGGGLGILQKLLLDGPSLAASYGLAVEQGGYASTFDVIVRDFGIGIHVNDARARLLRTTTTSNEQIGLYVGLGASVRAEGLSSTSNTETGIYVENALFDARPGSGSSFGIQVTGNVSGLVCSEGASCSTETSVVSNNTLYGITSQYGSVVTALHGQGVSGNTSHDYYVWGGSYIGALATSGTSLSTRRNITALRAWSTGSNTGDNGLVWQP